MANTKNPYSEEAMLSAYWDIVDEYNAKNEVLNKKREHRDAGADTRPPAQQRELDAEIKRLNYELAPIAQSMARLNTALGGRVGTDRSHPWRAEDREELNRVIASGSTAAATEEKTAPEKTEG